MEKNLAWRRLFKFGLLAFAVFLFVFVGPSQYAEAHRGDDAKTKKFKDAIRKACKDKRKGRKGDRKSHRRTAHSLKRGRGAHGAHHARDSARRAKRSVDGRIKDINRTVSNACKGGGSSCSSVKKFAQPRLSRLQRQSNQFANSMKALDMLRKQMADNQAKKFDSYDDMAAVKDTPEEEQNEDVVAADFSDSNRRNSAEERLAQIENELAEQVSMLEEGVFVSEQPLSAAEQALAYHLPQMQMLPNGKSLSSFDSLGFEDSPVSAPETSKNVGIVEDPFKVVAAETTRSTASQTMPGGVGKIEFDRGELDWLSDDEDTSSKAKKRAKEKPIDVEKFRPNVEDIVVGQKAIVEGYVESQTFTSVEGLSNWEKLRRRYEMVQSVMNK